VEERGRVRHLCAKWRTTVPVSLLLTSRARNKHARQTDKKTPGFTTARWSEWRARYPSIARPTRCAFSHSCVSKNFRKDEFGCSHSYSIKQSHNPSTLPRRRVHPSDGHDHSTATALCPSARFPSTNIATLKTAATHLTLSPLFSSSSHATRRL
jgi:hypothetical protein